MSRFSTSRAAVEISADPRDRCLCQKDGGVGPPGDSDPSDPEYLLPYADRERLGAVLANLQPRLTAVALRLTRDLDIAQDIVQGAFEKVVRHAPQYRGTARVSTWVHRVVVNEALMWLRAERRRARVIDPRDSEAMPPPVDERETPAASLDRAQLHARLHEGIARLAPEEREVVAHCTLAGMTYAEYAQATGSHPAAVKSRAHRARARLRRWLDAGEAANAPA